MRKKISNRQIQAFQKTVHAHFIAYGRHDLPWRRRRNAYSVLVSEVMLQQTQADRVRLKYEEFMSEFPTIHQLADASLKEVLGAWQGLGYNRRAKFLHESARLIVTQWAGKVPRDPTSLASLPGIGKATASAICAFAFNMPSVFIETNIRSVFIHHFFKGSALVDDKEIVCLV